MKKFQTYFCKAKLIIPFCLLSLFSIRSFSQELIPYKEPLVSRMEKSKNVVQEAEFIFEGIYVSETVQHTENHNLSIVRSKFLVQHVYKGNLKLGTVIIEQRGPVGHIIKEIKKDIYGKEYESITAVSTNLTSHGAPSYSKFKSAIFFCNAKQLSDVVNDSIDNKEILEFIPFKPYTIQYDYIDSKNINYELGGLYDLLFKTKTDFFKFLQEAETNISLPIPERVKAIQDSILYQPQRERHKKFTDSVNKRMLKRCINC